MFYHDDARSAIAHFQRHLETFKEKGPHPLLYQHSAWMANQYVMMSLWCHVMSCVLGVPILEICLPRQRGPLTQYRYGNGPTHNDSQLISIQGCCYLVTTLNPGSDNYILTLSLTDSAPWPVLLPSCRTSPRKKEVERNPLQGTASSLHRHYIIITSSLHRVLPKRPMAVVFTDDEQFLLAADKTGEVTR